MGRGRGRETVTVKPVLSGTVFLMANLDSFKWFNFKDVSELSDLFYHH